jgi:hypothetical protein
MGYIYIYILWGHDHDNLPKICKIKHETKIYQNRCIYIHKKVPSKMRVHTYWIQKLSKTNNGLILEHYQYIGIVVLVWNILFDDWAMYPHNGL